MAKLGDKRRTSIVKSLTSAETCAVYSGIHKTCAVYSGIHNPWPINYPMFTLPNRHNCGDIELKFHMFVNLYAANLSTNLNTLVRNFENI